MSVADLARAMSVTATAVRQRLVRLMRDGMVGRVALRSGRGRPSHRYAVTEKARRQAGNNFADLAMVLWDEVRAIASPEVRQGLLGRLARSLARQYVEQVQGDTVDDRMASIQGLLAERRIGAELRSGNGQPAEQPTLAIIECPYPQLAERDRGICAVENMLFSELLNQPVRLAQCRLDGHACCEFQTK